MTPEGRPVLRAVTTRELLEELLLRADEVDPVSQLFLSAAVRRLLNGLPSAVLAARRLEPGELST